MIKITRTERLAPGLYIVHGTNGRQVEIDRQEDGQWRVTGYNFSSDYYRYPTKRRAKASAHAMLVAGF